jgi:hypothetical protein
LSARHLSKDPGKKREEEQMVGCKGSVEEVAELVSCTGRPDVRGLELAGTREVAAVLVVAAQRMDWHQELTGTYSGEAAMETDYAEVVLVVVAEAAMQYSDSSSMGRGLEELEALEAVGSLSAV